MRSALVASAAFAAMTAACSGDDRLPPSGGFSTLGTGGAASATDAGAGAGGQVVAGDAGFADAMTSPDLGAVPIVDVAGGPCATAGGTARTITTAPEAGTTFTRTGKIGERRFAFGSDSQVLMTFAAGGESPSSVVAGPAAVSASDAAVAALLFAPQVLDLQLYGADAALLGAPLRLESATVDAPSVASGPVSTLAAWRSGDTIVGKIVAGGAVTGTFAMAPRSGGDGACATAAVADSEGFGLVFTRHLHDGQTKSTWARIGLGGELMLAKTLLIASGSHTLIDLARTPSGYVVLLGEAFPVRGLVVVRLDEFGNMLLPAHRLLGAGLGFGIASNGSNLGVAAALEDGRAAIRILDASVAPLGPWVCVDDSSPDSAFYAQAGIAADGDGWGIVARSTDLSASYRRTDHLGTGPP